jgi:hypothetical protein
LEHPIKGVIAKMIDLVELWLILESELVEHAMRGNLISSFENDTKNTNDYILSNSFHLTEFGSSMNFL